MKCAVCDNDSLLSEECSFCGEKPDLEFYEYKEITKPDEVKYRNIFNKWVNSIKDHDFTNLGNDIKFTRIQSMPVHGAGVTTAYETRTFEYVYAPGTTGQHYRRTLDVSTIDPWKIDVNVNGKRQSKILLKDPNTYQTVKCPQCANGRVTCGDCSGKKKFTCPDCRGHGDLICEKCDGKGKVNDYECHWCKGYGFDPCVRCQKSGLLRCETCDGVGAVGCDNCETSGTLEEMIVLIVKESEKNEYIEEKGNPSPEAKHQQRTESQMGIMLMDVNRPKLPVTAEALVQIPALHEKLRKILAAHDTVSSDTVIKSRRIWLERHPCIQVDYSFQEKSYRFFLNYKSFKFIDDVSPLKEFATKLVEESKNLLMSSDLKEVKKGIEVLEKTFRVGQNKSAASQEYKNFQKYLARLCFKTAHSGIDSRLGAELLHLRADLFGIKDDALEKFRDKHVAGFKSITIAVAIASALGLAAILKLALPKEFMTWEMLVIFFAISVLLGIFAALIATYSLRENLDKKIVSLVTLATSLLMANGIFYFSLAEENGVVFLGSLVALFIPYFGKALNFEKGYVLRSQLEESDRQALYQFLEKHWDILKKFRDS